MSQSSFESQIAEHPLSEHASPEQPTMNRPDEPNTFALSADDFSALEERVIRAVKLVKNERQARAAAEQRASKAEAQLLEQPPLVKSLQEEIRTLNAERTQVRQRVERLLSQLDALEL